MIKFVHPLAVAALALGGCASGKSGAPPVAAAPAGPAAPKAYVRPARPVLAEAPLVRALQRAQTTLPNGLKIVAVARPGTGTVSTRLVFLEGVATESRSARGSTLLSMALLGDLYEQRDNGARIRGEETLRSQIWYKGAAYAWDVGHDYAMIGVDGFAPEVEEYLQWLGDAVAKPRRGERMFVARRDSIIHALEDIELGDDATLRRVLERAAFGFSHPYARAIEGTQASLKKAGYEDIVSRQQQLLDPKKAVLLIVGDVDLRTIIGKAKTQMWRLRPPKKARRVPKVPPLRRASGAKASLIPQPGNRLMTVCAVSALEDAAVSDVALEGLATHLGGGLRSRLIQKLRVEPGLVYFAYSQAVFRKSARALVTCTRTPNRATAEVARRMKAVIEEAAAAPPSASDVRRVKAQLHAARRAAQSSDRAVIQAEVDRLTRGSSTQGDARAIAALDAAALQAAAAAVLGKGSLRFIFAGPELSAARGARSAQLGQLQRVSSVW